jgi:two-component system, chemotaxis family, protein-glutamate methylesterase/glutaminase
VNAHAKLSADWAKQQKRPIRVMLVDDSIVARSIFKRILETNDQIEVVYEAVNSMDALEGLQKNRVDILLLDIEMPDRSGLDALPDLVAAAHGARILVVSSFVEENGPAAVTALSLGACDTLAKPGRTGFRGRFSELLLEKVSRLGHTESDPAKGGVDVGDEQPSAYKDRSPGCIAIGASTGGIPAIYDVLNSLSPEINCPIFITQHLPDAFMVYFARQLAERTNRIVEVAKAGSEVLAGHVYVAPGNTHLVCQRQGSRIFIGYLDDYAASRYCPSVDALFESVATTYGNDAVAIVLSGMGNDGTIGARALSAVGAMTIVQDSASSVIWGMPGSIAREGLASAVMAPKNIGQFISKNVTA